MPHIGTGSERLAALLRFVRLTTALVCVQDNSGELSFEEFRRAVRKDAGMQASVVTNAELREMFDTVDSSGDGLINLAEFRELLSVGAEPTESQFRHHSGAGKVLRHILEHADKRHTNLIHLFHRFDKDSSGGLDREEFRQAMLEIGLVLDRKEMSEVMDEMDQDGDGFITTKEFADRLRLAKKDARDAVALAGSPHAYNSRHSSSQFALCGFLDPFGIPIEKHWDRLRVHVARLSVHPGKSVGSLRVLCLDLTLMSVLQSWTAMPLRLWLRTSTRKVASASGRARRRESHPGREAVLRTGRSTRRHRRACSRCKRNLLPREMSRRCCMSGFVSWRTRWSRLA